MFSLPGQWSVVNSMFIHNKRSLFIGEGRASVNLPNPSRLVIMLLLLVNPVRVGLASGSTVFLYGSFSDVVAELRSM